MGTLLSQLLTDGRIPSGAYAHSWGLEAAIKSGLTVPGVPGFIMARAESVGYCEAAFSAFALRASDQIEWQYLECELAARMPVTSTRKALGTVGAGLLESGKVMLPDNERLNQYSEMPSWTPRPVVVGILAGALKMDPADASAASIYEDALSVVTAATKLLSLDMRVALGFVGQLASALEDLALAASEVTDLPSISTPLLDDLSQQHASFERKLFVT